MEEYDGVSIIPKSEWEAPDRIFSTDACLEAMGGWSDGEFFKGKFPEWITKNPEIHINELEMLALIIGLRIWSNRVKNTNFLIYCDNQVTVDVINSGRAKN